ATNYEPKVNHDDDAIWERIRKLPFDVHLYPRERDETVRIRLRDPVESGPAVLHWIVEGVLRWQKEGLAPPDRVTTATAAYRKAMDPIDKFLEAVCVLGPDKWVRSSGLRGAYGHWGEGEG